MEGKMSERNVKKYLVSAVLCMLGSTVLPHSNAANVTINVASAYGQDNFQTQNLEEFARDVTHMTQGKVEMKVYPSGTLLKPTEIFSGVRSGKAEAGEVIMSSLTKENVMFGIDSLPFIVSGYADARHLWEVSRPTMEKLMTERGLKLLYAVPWPAQNLYSNREIKSIQDFRGQTMRSYNPITARIAELVGAKPVTIQVVDLSNAIAENKLDMMITSSWTGVDSKAWSKMRYYYKVYAWMPKNMVFMDLKLFNKLDSETQKKILNAAAIAEKRGWSASEATDQSYENQLAQNKIKISPTDFTVHTYLDTVGEKIAREWLKSAGPDELNVLLKYIIDREAAAGKQ
jgi:TRAP-type C4-dicarboxylate transport system substrate-binding protein